MIMHNFFYSLRPARLAVLLLPYLALAAHSSQAQTQVVKIGHVAPLSGSQASYGKDNENGARLAIEDLNAQGLMIGGKKIKFELIAEDDAADPKQGTAVAQKLCDAKINGVVGHLNSGTTIPAAKIYTSCGIPQITPSSTNPQLTQLGYKNVFRMLANDNALGAGLGEYAAKKLQIKRVAVIDDRTAYGKGVAEVFKKTALANGIQIVDEQFTNDKATDFLSILTAIKSKKPDAIFFGGMDPQAGPLLRQMQQLGLSKVRLLGGDGVCSAELPKLSGNAKTLDNVFCAVGSLAIDKMPQGLAWKNRYTAKYPGEFKIYSVYVYDATMVLADAMKRAQSVDPAVYQSKLYETNYAGVSGQVQFESNGERKNPNITMYIYKQGQRVPAP